MDRDAYIHCSELSNGKRVMYDKRNPEDTFVEYTPPENNMKRYYNSP